MRFSLLILMISTTLYGLDKAFTLQCPFHSQWYLRAKEHCNALDSYHCLYDANKLQNVETCRYEPQFEAPGYKIQVVGSLEGVQCASDRYQPFIFWTNGSNICQFEKSICAGEGQISLTSGTNKADTTCRCDYTKGYDFVVKPKHKCYCMPTEEDCSCFIQYCPSGYVLSPDYECAKVEELLSNSQCPLTTNSVYVTLTPNLSPNVQNDDHNYNVQDLRRSHVLKILVSVLVLLTLGICFVHLISECIFQGKKQVVHENEIPERQAVTIQSKGKEPVIHEYEIPKRPAATIYKCCMEKESLNDDFNFVPTAASQEILSATTNNRCVLITGPFGSGKTAIANHIISKLKHYGYEITVLSHPEEIVKRFSQTKKQLFVMDDILGKYSSNISDVIDKLEKCGSAINLIFKRSDTVKVLLTCRTYIYKLYEQYFEKYVAFVHTSLIEENLRLNLEERKQIYMAYFESDPSELITDDCLLLYHFFPLICSSNNKEYMSKYFKHPHKIVAAEISGMQQHSDTGYLALAILVVLNNRVEQKMVSDIPNSEKTNNIIFQEIFSESGFNQYPPKHTLQMTFMALKGEFIKDDDSLLSFLSPEMFDIVVACIGGSFIQSILKYSSSSFIKEKLQLFSKQKNNCSTAVIVNKNMEHKYYQRLTSDMNNNFIVDVLSNELFQSMEHRIKFLVHIRKHVKLQKLVDSSTGSNVIHILLSLGYSDIIGEILAFPDCPDINKKNDSGETPLHIACEKGYLQIVEWLIRKGAEVNKLDSNKRAALHAACQTGYIRIVEYLIRNNSSLNGVDFKGMTPVNIACANRHSDVVKYLVEKDVNINIADTNYKTPLHYACQNNMCKIVEILLLHRALVNKSDGQGYTPLHISCEYGNEEIVKLLVKHGAVTNSKNKQELTPMDIALKNRLENISSFLQQFKTSK